MKGGIAMTCVVIVDEAMRAYKPHGMLLSWDEKSRFEPDTRLELGSPAWKSYSHQAKIALPVASAHHFLGEWFVLFEELSPVKQAEIRRLFSDSPAFLR
jgi:hypothetical protein